MMSTDGVDGIGHEITIILQGIILRNSGDSHDAAFVLQYTDSVRCTTKLETLMIEHEANNN